jgi:hypothetical protein
MTTSETYRQPCGEWQPTPVWLQWLGKPAYRRALYAWPQIGGGWDGWEYASSLLSQDSQ